MRKSFLFMAMAAALSFLLFAPPLFGKSYRWIDENGEIRVTNYPPPSSKGREDERKNGNVTKRSQSAQRQVELYVTSWCPYCKQAAEFFRSRGIPFKSYDIEKDKRAAERKKKLDKKGGVPFAVVKGQAIHGYAPEKYANALKR